LIAAAEKVFAEKGTLVSLEDVARAAGVGPATLYRRFGDKEALIRAVLADFFGRLIDLARQAEAAGPEGCVDLFLETVGWELAQKTGFSHTMWGDLAPSAEIAELASISAALLARAQSVGVIRPDVVPADIAAAVSALRGIIASTNDARYGLPQEAWRRHLAYVLAGFRSARDDALHRRAARGGIHQP
jgi:AcrR family transcriptional regulator